VTVNSEIMFKRSRDDFQYSNLIFFSPRDSYLIPKRNPEDHVTVNDKILFDESRDHFQ